MMKALRHIIITSLVLVMCVSCFTPIAFAAAANAEPVDRNSILRVDFDDYMSSKEYYRSLLA